MLQAWEGGRTPKERDARAVVQQCRDTSELMVSTMKDTKMIMRGVREFLEYLSCVELLRDRQFRDITTAQLENFIREVKNTIERVNRVIDDIAEAMPRHLQTRTARTRSKDEMRARIAALETKLTNGRRELQQAERYANEARNAYEEAEKELGRAEKERRYADEETDDALPVALATGGIAAATGLLGVLFPPVLLAAGAAAALNVANAGRVVALNLNKKSESEMRELREEKENSRRRLDRTRDFVDEIQSDLRAHESSLKRTEEELEETVFTIQCLREICERMENYKLHLITVEAYLRGIHDPFTSIVSVVEAIREESSQRSVVRKLRDMRELMDKLALACHPDNPNTRIAGVLAYY